MTAAGGVTCTYDANGNQTGRGTDTFTFDHENRMTQSVVGGVTSSSVYYGNGVRRSHTVNGATTSYQYDVLASLPVVIQDGTYSYVYGLDLISMTDGSGNQHYFSYDGLGSLSDLTDATGAVTDTFAYDVFGAVTTRTGTTPNVWKFTGEQADDGTGDSGYYYLRARHYDPATGRFVGRDKLEFAQRYAYAGNNPALLLDPSGMCSVFGKQIFAGGCLEGAAPRLAVAGTTLGFATATCAVGALAAPVLEAGCLLLGAAAVATNTAALVADSVLYSRGELTGGRARLVSDGISAVGSGLGFGLALKGLSALSILTYSYAVPADAVNGAVALSELRARSIPAPPALVTGRKE